MTKIVLEDGEKAIVDYLSKGRYDRARSRNAETLPLNNTNDKYFSDKTGLFAELALAKLTNVYPSQVFSPVCKTKDSGDDVGDIQYKGWSIDVKSTIHNNGVLWINKINNNIDLYAFFVVKENDDTVTCELKGVITGKNLHAKPKRTRQPQFKYPCIYVEQEELISWEDFKKEWT